MHMHSIIKIPLDVVIVSTDSDGFLNREESRVDAVFNQSLGESLKEAVPVLKISDFMAGADLEMVCYEGNYNVSSACS